MTTDLLRPSISKNNNDLLKNKWLRSFMRSRWYPGIIQWPTLIVFMFIMFELLLGPVAAHDNFGTALTWVLWWPVIPILFLFLGRFWCAICPFATINDLVQKFVGNNRPVPKFLKMLTLTFGPNAPATASARAMPLPTHTKSISLEGLFRIRSRT